MTTETKERLVYNCYELCDLLGMSLGSVYKAIASGSIPSLRVGGRIIIPKKLLDEWLAKRNTVIPACSGEKAQ